MMDYRVVFMDMPGTIRGYALRSFGDAGDFYTIVLNSRLNREQNRNSFRHEIAHILRGDFDSGKTTDEIEKEVHEDVYTSEEGWQDRLCGEIQG